MPFIGSGEDQSSVSDETYKRLVIQKQIAKEANALPQYQIDLMNKHNPVRAFAEDLPDKHPARSTTSSERIFK